VRKLTTIVIDLQHAVFMRVLKGKFGLAPVENPQQVLDIGTGEFIASRTKTKTVSLVLTLAIHKGPASGQLSSVRRTAASIRREKCGRT